MPLADAAIATEIATAAARGRGADRAPTLEQLLAAFGEQAPTDAARRRVAAALRVAGMGVRPDLMSAEPGQRLMLLPPGAAGGRSRGRALLGLLAVAAVLGAAAAGASLLGGGDDDRAADSLPAATSTGTVPDSRGASDPAPASTATPTTDTTATTATDTAPSSAAPAQTTATTTTPAGDDAAAAARRRQRAAQRRRQAAATHTTVTVRVDATARPTFLCVDNGSGTTLFSGILADKQTFKGRRIRMNIGLASTRVTVNGTAVQLNGSPDGLDITRAGGAKTLPSGQRPCG